MREKFKKDRVDQYLENKEEKVVNKFEEVKTTNLLINDIVNEETNKMDLSSMLEKSKQYI